jgi:hypothetical protein
MEKPQMVSVAGLKARGWTQSLIVSLGEPDALKRNPHYAKAAPMRLYDLARVAAVEASAALVAAKAGAAGRRAGAKAAVETKRAALMRQIREMQVTVETRSAAWIRHQAIEAYNERNWDSFEGASNDSSPEFLERISVNFIRHNLTAYDSALEEVAGRVGKAVAVQAIRTKIYEAIAATYPALADECNRQLMRRGL